MHRYEELEKLYYKKIILKILIVLGIIGLFISGFFILNKTKSSKEVKKNISKNQTITKKENKKEIKKINPSKEKNETIKVKNNSKKEVKKSSLPKKINKPKETKVKSFHFILPDISKISKSPKPKQPSKTIKDKNTTKKLKKLKEVELNHTANLDNFKIVEKPVDLKTLIKKFNDNKDFDLAILISKIYFKKGDLKNAQMWALKANNINPSSYKSWILFADILLKEKKPKKVKEILKVYLNSYGQNDIIEKKLRSLDDK